MATNAAPQRLGTQALTVQNKDIGEEHFTKRKDRTVHGSEDGRQEVQGRAERNPTLMADKLPRAKLTDLTVDLDPAPIDTVLGKMVWATVAITYAMGDLEPTLAIRVVIPAAEGDKRNEALRRARQLIDHACTTLPAATPPGAQQSGILEGTVLEGLSQELGLAEPRTRSR